MPLSDRDSDNLQRVADALDPPRETVRRVPMTPAPWYTGTGFLLVAVLVVGGLLLPGGFLWPVALFSWLLNGTGWPLHWVLALAALVGAFLPRLLFRPRPLDGRGTVT